MNAGIYAVALIVYNDTLPVAQFRVDVEDGRWNTFPVLLRENGEVQAEKLEDTIKKIRKDYVMYSRYFLIRVKN